MMVYAYVHGIKQFRENELSIQKSVFKRLRVEHCNSVVVSSSPLKILDAFSCALRTDIHSLVPLYSGLRPHLDVVSTRN